MPSTAPRGLPAPGPRSVLAMLVVVMLSFTGFGLAAPMAFAHSDLVSSDPEDGAQLDRAPKEIVLTFSEPLLPDFVRVIVTNPDGEIGDLIITGVDGSTAVAKWPQNLVPGDWTVTYRVVSQDGHPVEGSISFSYVDAAPSPSPSPTSESASPTPDPTTPPEPEPEPTSETTSEPTTGPVSPTAAPSESIASPGASPASDTSPTNTGWIIAGIAVLVLAAIAIVGLVARSRTR